MSQCKQQPNDGQPQAGTCKNCGNCPSAKSQGDVVRPYIVVVGRMHGGNDSQAKTYINVSANQARRQFAVDVRMDEGVKEPSPDPWDEEFAVYVDYIFGSNSPISREF